jgi:hypothetical protein
LKNSPKNRECLGRFSSTSSRKFIRNSKCKMPRSSGLKDKSSEKNNGAVMKALKVTKPKKGRAKAAKNYDREKLLSAVKAVMLVS